MVIYYTDGHKQHFTEKSTVYIAKAGKRCTDEHKH